MFFTVSVSQKLKVLDIVHLLCECTHDRQLTTDNVYVLFLSQRFSRL